MRRWRRLVPIVVLAVVLFLLHRRLATDFWPPDASTIGPNLVASVVEALIVVVCWPALRGCVHRFIDAKIREHTRELHEKLDRLHRHLGVGEDT